MARWLLFSGGVLGSFGVALGAFAAHGLKQRLAPDLLRIFETGAHYQQLHAVAILAVGVWAAARPATVLHVGGLLLVAGVLVFSGSLYALALTGVRGLGAVTPLGGLCFLAGWACLAVAALRRS